MVYKKDLEKILAKSVTILLKIGIVSHVEMYFAQDLSMAME